MFFFISMLHIRLLCVSKNFLLTYLRKAGQAVTRAAPTWINDRTDRREPAGQWRGVPVRRHVRISAATVR